MDKINGLVLFSGGLDSMLAVKVLQAQGHTIEALSFSSSFYSSKKAENSAAELGIKLHTLNLGKEMLKLVKNPKSGYGKNLNPCIDCHALMIRQAGKFLAERKKKENDFAYLATGEVLGQRPFSQTKIALKKVSRLAGLEILRPLSAKLLPETEVEKNGLVKRHRLLDIEGRSRQRQISLAKKYKIRNYPDPAGGCLLTDPEFSERLGKMLEFWPSCQENDVDFLKSGRVYWLNAENHKIKILMIIGRDKKDNDNLAKLAKTGDYMLELKEINGPLTVLRGLKLKIEKNKEISLKVPAKLSFSGLKLNQEKNITEIINLAGLLTGYHSTKARGRTVAVKIKK